MVFGPREGEKGTTCDSRKTQSVESTFFPPRQLLPRRAAESRQHQENAYCCV